MVDLYDRVFAPRQRDDGLRLRHRALHPDRGQSVDTGQAHAGGHRHAGPHHQFGEQAGNSGKSNIGLNVMYFGGPLTLMGFYERADISNPVPPNSLMNRKSDWMLGGTYDFGMLGEAQVALRYALTRTGPGTSNVAGAGGFARTTRAVRRHALSQNFRWD